MKFYKHLNEATNRTVGIRAIYYQKKGDPGDMMEAELSPQNGTKLTGPVKSHLELYLKWLAEDYLIKDKKDAYIEIRIIGDED